MLVNVCELFILVLCVDRISALPEEYIQPTSKKAVSSHSYQREDVPLAYQYSLVHDYHRNNDVVKPKQTFQNTETHHASPSVSSNPQYSFLPEHQQSEAIKENIYTIIPKRTNLEPKPEIPQEKYRFHVPGHNVQVLKSAINSQVPTFSQNIATEVPKQLFYYNTTPTLITLQKAHQQTAVSHTKAVYDIDITTPVPLRTNELLAHQQGNVRVPEWLPHHHYKPNLPLFDENIGGKKYINEENKVMPKLPILHLNVARGYNYIHDLYNPPKLLGHGKQAPLYTIAHFMPTPDFKQDSYPMDRTHLYPVQYYTNQKARV